MPSAAQLVIADQVPTNHNFDPVEAAMVKTTWVNTEATTSLGRMTVSAGISLATAKRPTNRVTVRVAKPFEYTADGIVLIRDTARYNGEFVLPSAMSATEMLYFEAICRNFTGHATIKAMINALTAVW